MMVALENPFHVAINTRTYRFSKHYSLQLYTSHTRPEIRTLERKRVSLLQKTCSFSLSTATEGEHEETHQCEGVSIFSTDIMSPPTNQGVMIAHLRPVPSH